MSRSYKKNPFVTDNRSSKSMKRIANRIVRRRLKNDDEDMPARLPHKKMTESWNICDYRWRMTREDAIRWYENEAPEYFKKGYPTLESWLKYWEKCHRRK